MAYTYIYSQSSGNEWHTSIIMSRRNEREVSTLSGSVYQLVGDIDMATTALAGFTTAFIRNFMDGFPMNWRTLLDNCENNIALFESIADRLARQTATTADVRPPKVKIS